MSRNYFRRLLVIPGQIVVFGGFATAATYSARPCVSLEEIAAFSLHTSGLYGLEARGGSYRVNEVMQDSVLGQRWAMVSSCDHPEEPAFAVLTEEVTADKASVAGDERAAVVVHAGDVVRLWRQEDNLRIEMAAMSEENGGTGKTIRVRLIGINSAEHQFIGIVRGVGDVEMRR